MNFIKKITYTDDGKIDGAYVKLMVENKRQWHRWPKEIQ